MAFAAIYIPEFPSQSWLRVDRDARLHAIAVVEGAAPLERVISFNRVAAQLGLEHGMSKVQAEASGKILFRTRSIAEEEGAMDGVFEAAGRFSPRIQMLASPWNEYAKSRLPAAILLLDQTGTERLLGDARQFAEKIHGTLLELGFPANVALAPNAESSLLLARSYAGVTIVGEGELPTKLGPLSLSVLPCEEATLATLMRWGIRNLRELADLPETALISRIGQQARRLQRLARGTEDHLLVPEEPELTLSDWFALDNPLNSLESLLFILSPMLDRVLKQAIHHAYAVRSVTITLTLEKQSSHKVHVRPAVPVQSRDLLLKLLNLKLQAQPPQAGILEVQLSAEPAIPQVSQRGLFQAQFPEPDKLDLLVARLKSIVGEENVGSPVLRDSHSDSEFLMGSFQPYSTATLSSTKTWTVRAALRRFRPPQLANVTLRQNTPASLFWNGERLELSKATGPWQSSGYWWDQRSWEADEWDVLVKQPLQELRLRHETRTGTWYVAGQYD